MAKTYIFSTLANDQLYTNWLQGGGDMPIKGHSVLVKGGTGVANDRLITPLGVSTEITDYDLEELQKNPSFKDHEKNGFIVVKAKKAEAEKVHFGHLLGEGDGYDDQNKESYFCKMTHILCVYLIILQ